MCFAVAGPLLCWWFLFLHMSLTEACCIGLGGLWNQFKFIQADNPLILVLIIETLCLSCPTCQTGETQALTSLDVWLWGIKKQHVETSSKALQFPTSLSAYTLPSPPIFFFCPETQPDLELLWVPHWVMSPIQTFPIPRGMSLALNWNIPSGLHQSLLLTAHPHLPRPSWAWVVMWPWLGFDQRAWRHSISIFAFGSSLGGALSQKTQAFPVLQSVEKVVPDDWFQCPGGGVIQPWCGSN